jgi:hypothetical protein
VVVLSGQIANTPSTYLSQNFGFITLYLVASSSQAVTNMLNISVLVRWVVASNSVSGTILSDPVLANVLFKVGFTLKQQAIGDARYHIACTFTPKQIAGDCNDHWRNLYFVVVLQ